jgi:hypothetical protein
MSTKRERIGDFRGLLSKLVRVPKAELAREIERDAERKAKKRAGKRKN